MVKRKAEPYIYGKSPHPRSWHETVDILNNLQTKPKRKSSGLMDKLDSIEKMLKDKK